MDYRPIGIFALGLSACLPPPTGSPTGSVEQALGEPVGDRPAWIERLALYQCNASRVDPAATGWDTYPAVPPILWSDELAQAARAHSADMRDTPCFKHNSCDGTDPFKRIQSYWTEPFNNMGENIAAGVSDGQEVIGNWIDEIGAAPGTTGHRDNMFSKNFHWVGFGYSAGGTQFKGYWTQDFAGTDPAPPLPRVASGSHFPQTISPGGTVNFGAVYYDKGGVVPDHVDVVLDGKASPLTLYRGTPAAGAYQAPVKIEMAGEHRYYFRAVVGEKGFIYPDNGTLGVGAGSGPAVAEYAPGGVVVDPPPGGIDGGKAGGGCSIAPRPAHAPLPLALLVLLTLAARSTTSRAPSPRRRRAPPPAADR